MKVLTKVLLSIISTLIYLDLAFARDRASAHVCESYCQFASDTGIQRASLQTSGASKKQAWKKLNTACIKEKKGALQVHNDKFTTCTEADSKEACAQPEFFPATLANACR